MRHGRKVNHLSRTSSHRKAMLSNMATSLILHKRIETTVAKAKALRVYVEPLLTKSKNNTTHSRRVVFSKLKSKDALKELFGEVAEKIASRPGGYTRIIKLGNRLGDNAEMCMMELVDYNDLYVTEKKAKAGAGKKRTSRGKSGGGAKAEGAQEAESPVAEKAEKTPEPKKAEPAAEKETPKAEAPKAEAKPEAKKAEEKPAEAKAAPKEEAKAEAPKAEKKADPKKEEGKEGEEEKK